jgi:hypothetical protein
MDSLENIINFLCVFCTIARIVLSVVVFMLFAKIRGDVEHVDIYIILSNIAITLDCFSVIFKIFYKRGQERVAKMLVSLFTISLVLAYTGYGFSNFTHEEYYTKNIRIMIIIIFCITFAQMKMELYKYCYYFHEEREINEFVRDPLF